MKKLLISLKFIVLTFILLTSTMAGNITYFSPEGKNVTSSEYREECEKKAENLSALKKLAAKIDIQKPAGYNAPHNSRKYDFYSGEKKKQNYKSGRKRYYSRVKDEDLENKRLQRRNRQRDKKRGRLEINSEDKRRIKSNYIIPEGRECPSHLVEIYDYDSEEIRCASPSIAEDLAEQDPNLEIMGQ
ncbi:MAG: hypothetical protein ACQ9MH_24230 [Nitrospinales bacterium]